MLTFPKPVNTTGKPNITHYNPKIIPKVKVPSLGYQQRPPICRHTVSAVCTAVLRHVLSAHFAAAKGLGPTKFSAVQG